MSFEDFQIALDAIWGTTTQEVQKKMDKAQGQSESQLAEFFHDSLKKARAAFLQCFRNHAVVVDNEVTAIKSDLISRLEEMYGEKIQALRKQTAEGASLVSKHKDEVVFLKGLVLAQDNFITAMKHKYDLEKTQKLQDRIAELSRSLEESQKQVQDTTFQLSCSEQLMEQLRQEVVNIDARMESQSRAFTEERKELEEKIRILRVEMKQKDYAYQTSLQKYQETLVDFKRNTETELQIQSILNKRRGDALCLMEAERQRHKEARAKPTPRIGDPEGAEETQKGNFQPYKVLPTTGESPHRIYRIDAMGMDCSWKEYRGTDTRIRKNRRTQFRTRAGSVAERSAVPGPPRTPVLPVAVPVGAFK